MALRSERGKGKEELKKIEIQNALQTRMYYDIVYTFITHSLALQVSWPYTYVISVKLCYDLSQSGYLQS